jgi:hypothetical protein
MFSALVREGRYREAEEVLVAEIRDAHFVDPADDFSWGVAADALAYRVLADDGPRAFADYHRRLLALFIDELEPRMGHLHKGHLYYRLASGTFADDFDGGLRFMQAAVDEDVLKVNNEAGPAGTAPAVVAESPASIALLVLRRIQAGGGLTGEEWTRFVSGLPWLRFEGVWDHFLVTRPRMEAAVRRLLPADRAWGIIASHDELRTAADLGMAHSLPTLLAAFVERLLAGGSSRMGAMTPAVASALAIGRRWDAQAHGAWDDVRDADPALRRQAELLAALTVRSLVDRAVVDWAELIE